ncbi:MAG: bacillithiol biosynthesis BshC, partial [bacterium]
IGGPGEIAYWLQFKSMFEYYKVNLPILTWRNSFLIVKEIDLGKWQKQEFTAEELFNDINDLANKYVERHSDKKLNLDTERKELEQYFDKIKDQLSNINDQLPYSLTGIEVRLSHMLDNLEKKMLKHEKRKHSEDLEAIINIKSRYFPNNKLQERKENFCLHYAELGASLFEAIYNNTNLFESNFKVLVTGD